MTAHKANPEHWQLLEEYAGIDCYSDACLLELRARIEALEAANPGCQHIATSTEGTSYCRLAEQTTISQPTPNPGPLKSSLVERVARAIGRDYEPINWEPEARAAIREVLTWLKEGEHTWAALKLEQEAER
jgi:hypothetical protein